MNWGRGAWKTCGTCGNYGWGWSSGGVSVAPDDDRLPEALSLWDRGCEGPCREVPSAG